MDDTPVKKRRVKISSRIFRGETLRLTVNLVLTIVIFMALRNAFPVKQFKARMGKRYSLDSHERKKRATKIGTLTQVGALTQIGVKFLENGHYRQAADEFTELISLQPRYAPGHYRLAQALSFLDRYVESVTHLKEAVKIQPNFAEAYRLLGKNLDILNKSDEAGPYLHKAILLNPRLEDVHVLHGSCLIKQGKFEQAVEVLKNGARYHPDNPVMFRKLAEALEKLKQEAGHESTSDHTAPGR